MTAFAPAMSALLALLVALGQLPAPQLAPSGETVALRESGLLERGRLRHCPYTSTSSYVVLS